jgi:hypothetical protein
MVDPIVVSVVFLHKFVTPFCFSLKNHLKMTAKMVTSDDNAENILSFLWNKSYVEFDDFSRFAEPY